VGASEASRVFVEGNKVVAGESFMNGGGDLIRKDEKEEIGEVVKIKMM
jgi:hypothetical protein